MRILYVEDDPNDTALTKLKLQRAAPHYELETAFSIGQAIARLRSTDCERIDLVLTDMHLPDGDGLELLRHIRETAMPVAVVVVTGVGDEDTAVAALKARADDYVVKRKGYLDKLPVILESAFNHYQGDTARRSSSLKTLFVSNNPIEVESTGKHFAVHADHIYLDVVNTGEEALSILRDDAIRYDAVLLDFELADPSALHVVRELSVKNKLDTPVVLICNEADEELSRQGLKLGASSCIVKRPGYLYQLPWELEQATARAELQRREAELNASQERNRAILSAIPDLMFLLDHEGNYLEFHARNQKLLAKPAHELLGKHISEVLPEEIANKLSGSFP